MKNFIGVRVADSAEETGIGQRAFESMVLAGQHSAKRLEICLQWFDPSYRKMAQGTFSPDDMQRRTFLIASFGQEQRAMSKIERS